MRLITPRLIWLGYGSDHGGIMHPRFSRRVEHRAGWLMRHKTSDEWWRRSHSPIEHPTGIPEATNNNEYRSKHVGDRYSGDPVADTAGTANLPCKRRAYKPEKRYTWLGKRTRRNIGGPTTKVELTPLENI